MGRLSRYVCAAALLLVGCAPAGAAAPRIAQAPNQQAPQAVQQAPQTVQQAAPRAANAVLTIVASGKIRSLTEGRAVFEMGKPSPMDQTVAEQDFALRNDSKTPVTVARIQTSCGCTTAILRTSNGAPTTLKPGEQVSAHVAVNLVGLHAGPLHKVVQVFVQGQPMPAATLRVEGEIAPAVTFAPPMLSFGRVQAGAEHSVTLTATLDARLAGKDGALPSLVTSDPAIRVRPVSAADAKAKTAAGSPARTQTYEVVLAADAPLGYVAGRLEFVRAPGLSSAAVRALSGVYSSVTALVTGDISVQPPVVAFGAVPQGREIAREVALTGTAAADLGKLAITCDNPRLGAKLGPVSPASGSGRGARLEVRLAPGTAPGLFRSHVTLALPNGQRLIIPVSAYVGK
jgi:hypothetical protein